MECDEFTDVAAELALGVLTGPERADALAHLERCGACRETVRQLTMTGEQLLELLPAAEPPAGFESRVLARLGITVPDVPPPALAPAPTAVPAGQVPSGTGSKPGGRMSRRRAGRAVTASPPGRAKTDGRPGPGRKPRRRTLATMVTAMAVAVAALGGWGLHAATAPTPQSPLHSAALLSSTHQDVGQVYYYDDSSTQWVYMAVTVPSGDGTVTCELKGPGGYYTTVGTFPLTHGHGAWGSPARWPSGQLPDVRLLAPNGKVLATATL
jgi:anti-sigma-K factor RskA